MSEEIAYPEPGQLVMLRGRPFVVSENIVSYLPTEPGRNPQHLVRISSVDDEGLGEEAEFIWQLEPGARLVGKMALPEAKGFDSPERLDAFLDALRWTAISSADQKALQAPFRAGIEIEDYQLDPLVRALRMPRVNLLIADDVGLGKTIEAGLVAQELILRHRVRTILVVCPATIQQQWKRQMWDKFGLEFRIVDRESIGVLRRQRGIHVNPWTHFPRLITSIDYIKRENPQALLRQALPSEGEPTFPRRFDLLIVDEAAHIAPTGRGKYAVDSLRTLVIRTLAPHFEHKLFLSATPHNGYTESFAALLELIDNQRFTRGLAPDKKQLQAVMVRRLKSDPDLKFRWDGTRRFADREVLPLEVTYSDADRKAHTNLREYSRLRIAAAAADGQRYAAEFVLKLLKKRLFSSPAAFRRTLEQHIDSLRRAGTPGASSLRVFRRNVDELDGDYDNDENFEEAQEEAVRSAAKLLTPLKPEEQKLLKSLLEYARDAETHFDAKARQFLTWLDKEIRPKGKWNDRRIIIFTEYRDTQRWLFDALCANGFGQDGRLMTLDGSTKPEDRERIKAAFLAGPEISQVRILLATDAASEGIDLHTHCSRLVHFEIPWNPSRMEQRNGRVDRHGQPAEKVEIYHFAPAGYSKADLTQSNDNLEADLEFLMRAVKKVETMREDLGKVGPVIATQIEEAMLGQRRTLDTTQAERDAQPIRQLLKFERKLREELKMLHERLLESSRELHLSPESVIRAVSLGLELAGQPPLISRGKGLFSLPALSGSWAECARGLEHPHTQKVRPITFDQSIAKDRDDVVLVHLNHRLVQMCLRLLRAEVWAREGSRKLHRVTARLVPDATLTVPAVIAHGQLLITGGDQHRLHEEIIDAGGLLEGGKLVRMNVGDVERALAAAEQAAVSPELQKHLSALVQKVQPALMQALEARAKDRSASLQKHLDERAETEVADLAAILKDLEKSIKGYLHAKPWQQLHLSLGPEHEQVQHDVAAVTQRLQDIPQELERESDHLRARYAKPVPRLFPAAITCLIPRRFAAEFKGKAK